VAVGRLGNALAIWWTDYRRIRDGSASLSEIARAIPANERVAASGRKTRDPREPRKSCMAAVALAPVGVPAL
jgi:hypothetical protein